MSKILRLTLKFLISGLLLAVAFSLLDVSKVLDNMHRFSLKTVILVALFCSLSLGFQTMRWCIMAKTTIPGSLVQHIAYYWSAILFNIISPASLGGDVYRIVVYQNKTDQGAALPLGLIVQERFMNLIGYCFCYLSCLGLATFVIDSSHILPKFFLNIGILVGLGFIILILIQFGLHHIIRRIVRFLPGSWRTKTQIFSESTRYSSRAKFIMFLLVTQLSLWSWIGVYRLLAEPIMDPLMSYEKLGLISIVTEVSRWIPMTLQGLGVREGVAAYGFEMMKFNPDEGFLICGIAYLINSMILAIFGVTGIMLLNVGSWKSKGLNFISRRSRSLG